MLASLLEDDMFPFRLQVIPAEKKALKSMKPVMDIDFVESPTDFHIHADLPGVQKNEIDIHFENGLVTITAEKRNSHENKTGTSHHIERSFGRVQRSIKIPSNADGAHATASFENGVLEVKVPKTTAAGGTKVAIA